MSCPTKNTSKHIAIYVYWMFIAIFDITVAAWKVEYLLWEPTVFSCTYNIYNSLHVSQEFICWFFRCITPLDCLKECLSLLYLFEQCTFDSFLSYMGRVDWKCSFVAVWMKTDDTSSILVLHELCHLLITYPHFLSYSLYLSQNLPDLVWAVSAIVGSVAMKAFSSDDTLDSITSRPFALGTS